MRLDWAGGFNGVPAKNFQLKNINDARTLPATVARRGQQILVVHAARPSTQKWDDSIRDAWTVFGVR
jgi:hypothetical protein